MGLANLESIISKRFLASAVLSLFTLTSSIYAQECLVGKTIDGPTKPKQSNIEVKRVPKREEIKYELDGVYNRKIEQHREVVVKLAERCQSTGFEDAAMITGSGRIIPIGIPDSATIILQNGKKISAGMSYDFKKIMTLIKNEKEVYFYHCQPTNTGDVALSEPSLIDYRFLTLASLSYLEMQPEGGVFFRVVENSQTSFPYVISESVPSDEIKKLYQVAHNFMKGNISPSSTMCEVSSNNDCQDLVDLSKNLIKSTSMMLAVEMINKYQFNTLCQPLFRKDFENKDRHFSQDELALYLSKFEDIPKGLRELIFAHHNRSQYFKLRDVTSDIFGEIQQRFIINP